MDKNQYAANSCTAIFVGKNASLDGSTLVARNEDAYGALNPKKFIVVQPDAQPKHFKSGMNGFEIDLPNNPLRYTLEPNVNDADGIYGESGINSENITMSATETTFTSPRFLGFDPLVTNGLGEEGMINVVLPYIHSAREGVSRLGSIIEHYGVCESNGIAFSDAEEIWYLETAGGHQWAAQRIPDDAYVIAPNQIGIQEINFKDTDNFMTASNLQSFVADNHLNPNPETFNYRNIAGTHNEADRHYNTPRAWFGQKYLTPEIIQSPTSNDIPFIQYANRKIGLDDIQYVLSAHYQETPYDVFGSGTEIEKHTFRPMGIDRNQIMHILQIRQNVPAKYAALTWIAMGVNLYNTSVPFYTNVNETPDIYAKTTNDVDLSTPYWLNRTIAVLAEPRYHEVINEINQYKDDMQVLTRQHIIQTDQLLANNNEISQELAKANSTIAEAVQKRTYELFEWLVKEANNHMQLSFEKGQNL